MLGVSAHPLANTGNPAIMGRLFRAVKARLVLQELAFDVRRGWEEEDGGDDEEEEEEKHNDDEDGDQEGQVEGDGE